MGSNSCVTPTNRSISRDNTDGLGYEYDPWAIPDWDGDGIIDTLDKDNPNYDDQDGDGLPDYADPILDGPEWQNDPNLPKPWLNDDDGDGIPNWNDPIDDNDPSSSDPPPPPWDTDGDGIPDAIDRNPDQWDGPSPNQRSDSLWLSRNNQIGTEGSPSNPMHLGSASAFIGDPANGKNAARSFWKSAKTFTGKGNMQGGIRFGPKASAAQAYSNNANRSISIGGAGAGPGNTQLDENLETSQREEVKMKYETARKILAEAIETINERKLFDPALGHSLIGSNPKARDFNPKTARPNKVKKRNWEKGVGRTIGGSSHQPDARHVYDGRAIAKDLIREEIELSESTKNAKSRYRKGIANAMKKIGSIKKPKSFKPIDNPFTKPFKDQKK